MAKNFNKKKFGISKGEPQNRNQDQKEILLGKES